MDGLTTVTAPLAPLAPITNARTVPPHRAFDGEEHMTAKKAVVRRAVKAVDRGGEHLGAEQRVHGGALALLR